MEYTKGEWALIEDEDTFQIYVPTKFTVAKIHKRWGDDAKANARLIASAPDLYEACVTARGFLVCYEDKAHKEIADIVRKAIRKAEGGN